MPSQALKDFKNRTQEVRQLLDAHGALTRLRRAEGALQSGGQSLRNVGNVVIHLVSTPGRGRPAEVHALNSAGIALLSAHLQGFIVDLFKEVTLACLDGKVRDVGALQSAANTRGNPNWSNITKLFRAAGFPDILSNISWQRMSNEKLRQKLESFNKLRNEIVHGTSARVRKAVVSNYLKVLTTFAEHLDNTLRREVRKVTRRFPW